MANEMTVGQLVEYLRGLELQHQPVLIRGIDGAPHWLVECDINYTPYGNPDKEARLVLALCELAVPVPAEPDFDELDDLDDLADVDDAVGSRVVSRPSDEGDEG